MSYTLWDWMAFLRDPGKKESEAGSAYSTTLDQEGTPQGRYALSQSLSCPKVNLALGKLSTFKCISVEVCSFTQLTDGSFLDLFKESCICHLCTSIWLTLEGQVSYLECR